MESEKKEIILTTRKFIPLFEGVVIQVLPFEERPGGILMPDLVKGRTERTQVTGEAVTAVVISVGPEVRYTMIGERVLVGNSPMAVFKHGDDIEVAITTENRLFGRVIENKSVVESRQQKILGEDWMFQVDVIQQRQDELKKRDMKQVKDS